MNEIGSHIRDFLTPHSASSKNEVCSSVDNTDIEIDGDVDHEANQAYQDQMHQTVYDRKQSDNANRAGNLQKSSSNGFIKISSNSRLQRDGDQRLLPSDTSHCDGKLEPVVDMVHIKDVARKLGYDVVNYAVQKTRGDPPKSSDPYVKTMRRTVDYLLEKHQIPFTSMAKKLQIGEPGTSCRSFVTIADEMFIDKQYNWGRVVTLYAFAACLANHCVSNNISDDWVERIGETVGDYVTDNLADWICRQGGWDDMVRFFPEEEDSESKIWRGLFYTMIGLGALATTMAAVR